MTRKDAYLFWIWSRAHIKLGALPSLTEFLRVRRAYSEEGRHYHTWTHVYECIKFLFETYGEVPNWHLIVLALFYHDVVYEMPGQAVSRGFNNEEESAHQWERYSQDFVHYGRMTRDHWKMVSDLILMTKAHKPEPHQGLIFKIMSDVDMAILGTLPDVYLDYARKIWREYSAVGRETYLAGRLDFLSKVDPETLFHTHQGRDKLLVNARVNIAMERKLLNDSPDAIMTA